MLETMVKKPADPVQQDKNTLRSLAARVREIAELPEQAARKERWLKHNRLEPGVPLVLCFPEGAWTELVPEESLKCRDKKLRAWEKGLRQQIYWWEHLRDDNILEPYFNLIWQVDRGSYGVEVPTIHGENRGSYRWDPPIKDLDRDFAKLSFRQPRVDRHRTLQDGELASSLFGDLLPVRIRGAHWWTMGLTWEAIRLVGLEGLMLAMYDNPKGLHRLMAWLRDDHLQYIQWFEKEGLLSLNNRADYVGSGGVGYTNELPAPDWTPGSPVRLEDLWGFAESQETVGVSPGMFAEFIFPYQLPLLEKFGLNCYGCCEGVHERLDQILTIPGLRRISVSPWADQQIMADALQRNIIFSRKPNPALVCAAFDEKIIQEDLRTTLDIAQSCILEIILKDTHTVQNEPWRLKRWVKIVREEINNT
jgi:hypothetical protein